MATEIRSLWSKKGLVTAYKFFLAQIFGSFPAQLSNCWKAILPTAVKISFFLLLIKLSNSVTTSHDHFDYSMPIHSGQHPPLTKICDCSYTSIHLKNFWSIFTAYLLCFIPSLLQVAIINVVAIILLDSTIFKVVPFQNMTWRDDILNKVLLTWMELSVLLSKQNRQAFET